MRDIDPKLIAKAEELKIPIKGNWGNTRIQQAIDAVDATHAEFDAVILSDDTDSVEDKFKTVEWASERASKMYAGQSPHLGMAERIGRIRAALKERGYTRWEELVIDGAVDYQRYL